MPVIQHAPRITLEAFCCHLVVRIRPDLADLHTKYLNLCVLCAGLISKLYFIYIHFLRAK